MPDVFTKAKRSQVMATIRARGNRSTEQAMIALFRVHRITGWRRGQAVFVDGCFWHGCPKHATLPVQNRAFWRGKFQRNIERDRNVTRRLRREGWSVIRIWEHALKKNGEACIGRIRRALERTPRR